MSEIVQIPAHVMAELRQAEIDALREQNRVLRSNLVNCVARLEAYYGEDYPAVRDAKAALTATSQPQVEIYSEPVDKETINILRKMADTSQEGQG